MILLETGSPLFLVGDDLDDLAERIRNEDLADAVEITSVERRGMGVTWWEVLRVWVLEPFSGEIITALVAVAVAWARQKMKAAGEKKRPQYIAIYGPDGKVVKSVVLKDPDDEPEDLTEQDAEEPPREPPR